MAEHKAHKRERGAGTDRTMATPGFLSGAARKRGSRAVGRTSRPQAKKRMAVRPQAVAIVLAVLLVLALAGAVALAILSNTSAFPIRAIEAEATEHVSSEDIARLAGVPEGTTMLNYDEGQIIENLTRNPWIGSVRVRRSYPDKLRIEVTERKVHALVLMNAGSVIWCLGDDNVWIEPLKVVPAEGQSMAEAALAKARSMGALLVTDVPQSVEPLAGSTTDHEVFTALAAYRDELSDEFWADIVSFSAPSDESISCILASGVEVSLGNASNIEMKEEIVTKLLQEYPGRLTYINVRVPANPSYRMVDTEAVQEGTGALG